MLESQRHQLILDILDELEFASVHALTEHTNASEATIRRDLVKLADEGQIEKVRGGARACGAQDSRIKRAHLAGSAFLAAREKQPEAKRLIAQRAVELCEDGESIIINGGSSTFMMGEFLARRELNILTNSFVLAQELANTSQNQITLPGGELYRRQGIILSAYEQDTIAYYSARKMFMGTPGISELGVTESDPLLITSEQKLHRQSEQLIVLADSSKLGQRAKFIFCPPEAVDLLITDSKADRKLLKALEKRGVNIEVVSVP
ncbi:DeoR/GlpR family DNA-binding transcription regulator [Parahaliea mediterranea]|uniref:DeoR/GlpR family DNA-binding transcription regulator n=1 Tax=Parahaliea mediterranea TaxID=651086 RepID=UPI000E2E4B51|nr:DeoR/GlpR family DNA-binding transcription regulator [Parahaliea mediterranea]